MRVAAILLTGWLLTMDVHAGEKPIRVLVWDEQQPAQKSAYPNFLGNQIATFLKAQTGLEVTSVSMNDPEQGLSKETLENTDVLVWWGHVRHKEFAEERAQALLERIKAGKLGLIALHSAHFAKPFVAAMHERAVEDGLKTLTQDQRKIVKVVRIPFKPFAPPKANDPLTPSHAVKTDGGAVTLEVTLPNCCFPSWRADGAASHVTTLMPDHPIAKDIPRTFDIPHTEMYNEPYHVPVPDALIFEEKWDTGERFRSGMVWHVGPGKGKVFYFRPGHETYKVYHEELPLKILLNAVRWMAETK